MKIKNEYAQHVDEVTSFHCNCGLGIRNQSN